jgi:hypothetical protein
MDTCRVPPASPDFLACGCACPVEEAGLRCANVTLSRTSRCGQAEWATQGPAQSAPARAPNPRFYPHGGSRTQGGNAIS